jgi:hypothetical protein
MDDVTAPPRSRRRARAGRVCRAEGCGTRLSVYNDGAFCSLHAPMVVPRTRGRKVAG